MDNNYSVNRLIRKGVKALLECKAYPAPEMWQMLGVKDNQGAQRKLSRYGVRFFANGWGKNASFNITAIDDPFKVYCILEMGFDANCDFKKLRNYLFFLLGEDEYCWLPDEPMEKYMRSKGFYLSRQTITKYREHLERLNYIHGGDFIYYRVYRDDRDRQCYQQVEKEEYSKAWRVYWDMRNDGADSELAFACMYSAFGGVPRKQAKLIKNAFHLKELNYLLDLVSTSIYNEASIWR